MKRTPLASLRDVLLGVVFSFQAGSRRTSMTAPVRLGSLRILACGNYSFNRGIVRRPLLSIFP